MNNHVFKFWYRQGKIKNSGRRKIKIRHQGMKNAIAHATSKKRKSNNWTPEHKPSDILFDAHTAVRGLCDMLSKSHLSASS